MSLIPAARGELEGVWDPKEERFVFFGGNLGIPEECSYSPADFTLDVWAWNSDCGDFEVLAEGADGPGPRGRFASAYAPSTHSMLVHGGRNREASSGNYDLYDELWSFDLASDSWQMLSSGAGPEARVSHSGVLRAGKFIVHGGNSSANGAAYIAHSDTWAYDLAAGTWEELSTTGNPPERLFHGGALSEDEKTLYVFAGGDERAFVGPFLNDIWALDLDTLAWSELHAGDGDAPAGRLAPVLVADDARNRLLAFGGHDDGELGNTNQVWSFDLASGSWSAVRLGDVFANPPTGFCEFPADFTEPDFESPERRHQAAGAPTGDGRLMIFGGKTDCGAANDIWSFDYATEVWTQHVRATTGEICLRAYQECTSMCT